MAILKNLIVNGVTRVIGDLTASKIIKQGGLSSEFLKADGSVDGNAYIVLTSTARPGVTRLYRRDEDSIYNVLTHWDGTYWVLLGYIQDTYYAPCRVGYADNANKVNGYNITASYGKYFGKIPIIESDGVTELGRYIDFHYDTTTTSDYSTRLEVFGNNSNTVILPSASGTLALTSQIPTSLPANGGTSDYAKYIRGRNSNGTYYDSAASNNIIAEWNTKSDNRWYLKSASTYECRVDYASSAGNADTLDNYHVGLANGSVAIYVPFPGYSTLKNNGYISSSYEADGYPGNVFLQGICKWAIDTYPNRGEITLIGTICPNSSGTCILHLYSSAGKDSSTNLPRYCRGQYMELSGKLYQFGTVDYVWSYGKINASNADTLDGYHASDFATVGHTHDYLPFYLLSSGDCNTMSQGLTTVTATASNQNAGNHSTFLTITNIGTPFQLQIPDSDEAYIYKRYKSGSSWSSWAKLFAGYADSAGNADTVDNMHASDFATANHTHLYLPLAGGTLTGSVTMQGMNTNFVRNITCDNTGSWARNIIALNVDGVQKFVVSALGDYTLGANNNGIIYAYIGCNEYNGLNLRITATSLSWGDNNILHAGNYNSYTPKLDGTGATGDWRINISGNAATATKLLTTRSITLTGSVTGSVLFDGTSDISIATSTNHTHSFESLISKPTTIEGYGITNALVKKSIITKNDYEGYVILLCKIGTNTTNIEHTINGTFWTTINGGVRYQAAYINVHCSDWTDGHNEYYGFTPFGLGTKCRLVICNYESNTYLAVTFENDQACQIYFNGSYSNILFTPILYYTSNTGTINNLEIYDSISEVTSYKLAFTTDNVASATYATSADNADTCDGLHVNTDYRNTEANKIVHTDDNGYLQCGYINSSYGDEGNNSSPARVWGTNGLDSYLRTYLTSAISVGYATNAGSSTYSSTLEVLDVRGSDIIPSKFDPYRITGWFNESTGLLSGDWCSGITVKGWSDGYSSWQLAGYSSTSFGSHGLFFREAASDSGWRDWIQIITSDNISSLTVAIANLARTLSLDGSIKLYVHNNNELNFGGTNASTTIYFGYRTADSRAIPTSFVFGGSTGSATLTANGFIKKDSSDANVLLGGGGHKALSNFVQTSGDQSISGTKTFTGTIKVNRAESTTGFFLTSDIRYKNIIEFYYSLSDKIAQLPIIKYKWTDRNDNSIYVGSSALSVMSIMPELVTYDDNTDFYSLDYATLGAIAGISACREVETLKLKVKDLEQEIIFLKSKYNG